MVKKSAKTGNMHLETMLEAEAGSILTRFFFLFSVLLSLLFLVVVAVGGGLLWVFWTYGKDLPDYNKWDGKNWGFRMNFMPSLRTGSLAKPVWGTTLRLI